MFKAFLNLWKVKELRTRLLFTMLIIVLVRVASNIPCPGVDPAALEAYISRMTAGSDAGGLMAMIDIFSGGALAHFALGALGIMPYITASIILQLLVPVIPQLEKLSRQGDTGRQQISQYTRYLTIAVCLIQGIMVSMAMVEPTRLQLPAAPEGGLFVGDPRWFVLVNTVVLTCTTMVFMWMGEQVTERGIGNGVSIIITINIISRLPHSVIELVQMAMRGTTPDGTSFRPVQLLLLLAVFAAVTAATILLSQGYRRVPIQMIRKTTGNQIANSSTYMPLKVNFANVMPIIFAGAIMMFPDFLFRYLRWERMQILFQHGGACYMVTEGLLILVFSYFWVANQFNPIQIADNLKAQGAYIPGITPGQATADFLDSTMTRVTFGGSIFLVALALFPMFLYSNFRIPFMVAQFFGGTSLLIMVGVVLDTMRQLESHLTMRHYDGFLKSGRLRGRSGM